MRKRYSYPFLKQQQGVALIICLLLLMVLTIVSVSAMQSTILEEKMAGNMRDYELAFQSSETALRSGENEMLNIALDDSLPLLSASDTGSGGIWSEKIDSDTNDAIPWWDEKSYSWWNEKAKTTAAALSNVAGKSQYIIEWQQFVKDDGLGVCTYDGCSGRDFHQITSRAEGGSTDTVVLLQSTFAWRYQ